MPHVIPGRKTSKVDANNNRPKSVAASGGPLPDVRMIDCDAGDGFGRRKRMPFKSMEEYENFLRRVA